VKTLRLMAVLISFAIEVKVKAIQQEPVDCLSNKEQTCSLFSMKQSLIDSPSFNINMMSGSALYRDDKKKWNLVSGTIRISNKEPIKIQTRVGKVSLKPGVYWMQWSDEKLWVVSLKGMARLELISNPLYNNILPEGFTNWYGLISYNKVNQQGIPRAIGLDFISEIIPSIFYHKDRSFIESRWSRSIAQSSDFYHDIVQQTEDLDQSRKKTIERMKLNRIKAEAEVQNLFRQKYLSPIDLSHSLDEDDN